MDKANKIIDKHTAIAIATSTTPIPIIDLAALWATHSIMLKELADYYEQPLDSKKLQSLSFSLISSLGTFSIGGYVGSSIVKFIPGMGTILGITSLAFISSATTYALGHTYSKYAKKGGDMSDSSFEDVKKTFQKEYLVGRKISSDLIKKNKSSGN